MFVIESSMRFLVASHVTRGLGTGLKRAIDGSWRCSNGQVSIGSPRISRCMQSHDGLLADGIGKNIGLSPFCFLPPSCSSTPFIWFKRTFLYKDDEQTGTNTFLTPLLPFFFLFLPPFFFPMMSKLFAQMLWKSAVKLNVTEKTAHGAQRTEILFFTLWFQTPK